MGRASGSQEVCFNLFRRKAWSFALSLPGSAGCRLVRLAVGSIHGSDAQVAAVVLIAQAVMVPVALASGWLCERWGRKPVFAVGFLILPLRIFLYSLTQRLSTLLAMQSLDRIGAGIYGVAVAAMSADLTHGKGHFNALMGVFATALSVGGVLGVREYFFLQESIPCHQNDPCDQEQSTQRPERSERMLLHPQPAEVIDQHRADERGGYGKAHEGSSAHFFDQRQTGINLDSPDEAPERCPPRHLAQISRCGKGMRQQQEQRHKKESNDGEGYSGG